MIIRLFFWLLPVAIFLASCRGGTTQEAVNTSASQTDSGWALTPFKKLDAVNPVLVPGQGSFRCPVRKANVRWEEKDVFNPAIVVKDQKLWMLYRAQDRVGHPDGTSRIGVAESTDGLHFSRHAAPVVYPDNDAWKKYEWEGGCEDPRVVEDGQGTYYMTYTAFDGRLARLMVAKSRDLQHWTKQGPAFAKAYAGKYLDKWSKSGSIVSRYTDGRVIATKINGKYWMYWGDQYIWAATSDDLLNWQPVEMQPGEKPPIALRGQALNMPELKIVVPTRRKKFDSDLVESGPPAMLTDKGIVLIYNSRNDPAVGDSSLVEGTYAAGQVLLDRNNPLQIIDRMPGYFMKPDKPYEQSGQVNQVCFPEGLAWFQQRWLLYYGTADSKIAVAAKE
ncbi:MAG TPA: glycoside hydrolase family 130 protein [Puia sp.]|nr:glycoside hydrolase family 130 protein [Puia sp.]